MDVFGVLFASNGYAQDEQTGFFSEQSAIATENRIVNNVIDELVKDYLIREKMHGTVAEFVGTEEKNNSQVTSRTSVKVSKDRELSMKFSKKGNGADLQVLDKIYGTSEKLNVLENSSTSYDTLNVSLHSCFYKKEDSPGDALALISITDSLQGSLVFNNWFSTTYSNLTNFNNQRYSMWLLSCTSSDQE